MYFSYRKNNGILKFLYKRLGNNYYSNLVLSASCNYYNDLKYVFDFNESTFWITENNAPDGNYLEFCLPNYSIKITGYEITAPIVIDTGTPFKWGFSAGNTSANEVTEEYKMAQGETHYVKYEKPDKYKCFRYINRGFFTANEGIGSGYRSRVSQIEIFGYLYGIDLISIYISRQKVNMNYFLIVFIIMA